MSRAPRDQRTDTDEGSPTRRCIVCRNTERKHALLRFVIGPDGEVLFDARQKLPGRGINVSAERDCLEKAARGAFRRGAKGRDVTLPPPPIDDWIASAIVEPLTRLYGELISMGRASGQLVCGANQVERAAASDELGGYLLATDASDSTRKKVELNAGRKGLPVLGLLSRRELGRLIGREEAVVCGWVTGTLLERCQGLERQLSALGGVAGSTRHGEDDPRANRDQG